MPCTALPWLDVAKALEDVLADKGHPDQHPEPVSRDPLHAVHPLLASTAAHSHRHGTTPIDTTMNSRTDQLEVILDRTSLQAVRSSLSRGPRCLMSAGAAASEIG